MWVFILLLPSCSHPIYLKIKRWKNPHFPISDIYFVATRKGTLPGHDLLHVIHTSQFPWLSVLEDDLSVAEEPQLLLPAEVKQVAISSSLEAVNCGERSWASHARLWPWVRTNWELCSPCSREYSVKKHFSLYKNFVGDTCQNDTWIVTFLGLWCALFARESIAYRRSDSLCTLGSSVCVIPVPPQKEAPRKAAANLCKLNKLLGSSEDSQLNHN